MTAADYIAVAYEEGRKGLGHVRPNPAVGAVIVRDGEIIGRGWHKKCGQAHAEVEAIENARKRGFSTFGSTIYVTLEPCSKAGRVGACTDAIREAGISHVVYAVSDPNPKNRGKAKRALARAGITCEKFKGDPGIIRRCEMLIQDFRKHVTTGLPYVTVKIAMSLDGQICDLKGDARWISSSQSRQLTGTLRQTSDVIMVGAETIRNDDPSLLSHEVRNDDLYRVVISKSGNLPKCSQVFIDEAKDRTLVYRDAVEAIHDLGQRGFTSVLCEGGLKLARSLSDAGLVDCWVTVLAPIVIGEKPIGWAKRGVLDRAFIVSEDTHVTAMFPRDRLK